MLQGLFGTIAMMSLAEALLLYQDMPQFENMSVSSPNEKGFDEDAPIHVACRLGNVEHVEVFLESGADSNLIGDIGNTPLHNAALCGHASVVELLLKWGARKDSRNEFGETPIDTAMLGDHQNVAVILARP
jgi:uncharacterized protein